MAAIPMIRHQREAADRNSPNRIETNPKLLNAAKIANSTTNHGSDFFKLTAAPACRVNASAIANDAGANIATRIIFVKAAVFPTISETA